MIQAIDRNALIVSSCGVFLLAALALATLGASMFGDADPFWHIAAGDLIRATRAIPDSDPWSFTAGDYRWLNISWLWDALMSLARERLGWHGAVAINAVTVALTLTLVYANCALRCRDGIAAFLATLGAMTLLDLYLRPLQVTTLMIAAWALLLGLAARGECRLRWLALLPLSTLAWVNMHGGFIAGPALLGAFLIEAIMRRNAPLARALGFTLAGTFLAMLINPYGLSIIEAVWRPMTTVANQFLDEWRPFTATPYALLTSFYAVLFVMLVPRRALPVLTAERWLAYGWLLLALTSVRYFSLFAVLSAPAFASALIAYMKPARQPTPLALSIRATARRLCGQRAFAAAAAIACLLAALWLPGAARFYRQETLNPVPALAEEIAFLKAHPARMLSHFDFGGVLIYETRGEIPVFMDGRTETAYPRDVMLDYMRFELGEPGWEAMLERRRIDGVMIPNKGRPQLMDRFAGRKGWQRAFRGPHATIFMRAK